MSYYHDRLHNRLSPVHFSPTFLEDVETNVAIRVNVWVEHLRMQERHFWGLHRVLSSELKSQMEDPAFPFSVIWTKNYYLPE